MDGPAVEDPAPRSLETSILFDVFALNQAVARLLAAGMRDGPQTPAEYALSSAIFELEAASPTAIAHRLGMRLTTFMDQLRSMVERGHARRVGNPADRRSYRVVLTADGLAAHREANRRFEAAYAAFLRELRGLDPDGESLAKRGIAVAREAAERAMRGVSAPADVPASRPRSGDRAG
jgi:DNA-binding MarR family transcriptional regulator